MGSNSVQAQGIVLFFVAFVLLAAGVARGENVLYLVAGVVALASSIWRFRACKAWEEADEQRK